MVVYRHSIGLAKGACSRCVKDHNVHTNSIAGFPHYTALASATITIASKNFFQKKLFFDMVPDFAKKEGRKAKNNKNEIQIEQIHTSKHNVIYRLYIEYKVCHSLTQSVI